MVKCLHCFTFQLTVQTRSKYGPTLKVSYVVSPVITSKPLRLPYALNTYLAGPPLSFTACRWPYPGSLTGAHALCFPASSGLLPSIKGSARIPYRVYPFIGLSQLYPSDQMSRGCTIRFMLRPAVLAGPPDWVGHALCMPSRDRVGASSARVLPHEPALCLLIQKGN
jgi:hypothetical protein